MGFTTFLTMTRFGVSNGSVALATTQACRATPNYRLPNAASEEGGVDSGEAEQEPGWVFSSGSLKVFPVAIIGCHLNGNQSCVRTDLSTVRHLLRATPISPGERRKMTINAAGETGGVSNPAGLAL
jgi:hypothetical protein